jgi:putative endonuclease
MIFVVYILFSDACQKFYTGQTADLPNRIEEHNAGETPSIRRCRPWHLIWSREVSSRSEAVQLEAAIKKRGARRFLEDLGIR